MLITELAENIRYFDRHGAVEIDRHFRDIALIHQGRQQMLQGLRTPNRKGRNQQHATTFGDTVNNFRQLLKRILGVVPAVAVSGLHQQQIQLRQWPRRFHQHIIETTDITRKADSFPFRFNDNAGGAENMTGRL